MNNKPDRLEGTYSNPINNIDHIGCLRYICIFVFSLGISYAELRYDVPNLVNNKPDRLEGTYSNPINNIDHIQSLNQSLAIQGGMYYALFHMYAA